MIKEFDHAIVRAERSIADLSSISKSATEQVQKATENADEILEELKTVYEIGEKTSSKLEARITEARQYEQLLGSSLSTKAKKGKSKTQSMSNGEDDNSTENYIPDIDLPEHQNLLEKVLSKITTHRHKGTVDQASYYDSLRKLSIRK
jgi:hypothetical protein